MSIRPGSSWCDVVKHVDGGALEFVHLRGTMVVCENAQTGAQRWVRDTNQALLYLRAAADGGGRVCAIGQGHHDGQAWATVEGRRLFSLGPTHGVFPVLVHGLDEGWVCVVQHASDAYARVILDANGREVARDTLAMPPTSQGFLYLSAAGEPVTQDAGRNVIVGLALPSPAADVWVGQSTTDATIALFDLTTNQITPLNTPGGQPPHIIGRGGTYFVCSYVDGGAWLSTHRRPFAVAPPIDPPPVEPPQETPVRLEQKHSALIEAFAARFPPPGGDEDALRDHWTPRLVEQFVFSFPGEGWCWKSTSPGSRPSSDVVARRVGGGAMWGYDVILGAGTGGWSLNSHAGPIDLRTQAPIAMNPKNHLGTVVEPPPPPPPPSGFTFPTGVEMPEDVALSVIDGYLEGIRERDKVRAQDTVPSRGALMYLFAVFFRELSSWIVEKKRAPIGVEWWAVRERIVAAAVKYYQDRQGVD